MTNSFRREDLSLEHQLVLRAAASRLQHEFEGVFAAETIERFLHSSYDDFAGRFTVVTWSALISQVNFRSPGPTR